MAGSARLAKRKIKETFEFHTFFPRKILTPRTEFAVFRACGVAFLLHCIIFFE
jgi:hypothetical protein